MSSVDIFGSINTLFIIFSLYGVFSQLKTIWARKTSQNLGGSPTSLLSLNQLTVSYFAYLSFFVYGYSVEPFNHYIVWPRFIASVLVGIILFEIWFDRRTLSSLLSLCIAGIVMVIAIIGLLVGSSITDQSSSLSISLIVIVTVFIAQGYYHQIRLILSSGSTGAVDIKMSQFILMMDISTIAFGLSLGIDQGWPLLFLSITSGVTKVILMYLFRWVRLSPVAAKRRALQFGQL